MKLDLLKALQRSNWLYSKLTLIHIGFCLQMVNWIMGHLSFLFFLINGFCFEFFRASRGLKQGYSLFPLLFLIIVEGFRLIVEAKCIGSLDCIKIGRFSC